MSTVIAVGFEMDEADLARIRAVAPDIELRYLSRETLADDATARAALADVEVLLTWWGGRWQRVEDLSAFAPRLRWVQLGSAGSDAVLEQMERLGDQVVFTNAAGINASVIAECVVGYILLFAKRWLEARRNQAEHRYARFMPGVVEGSTVGILGMGHIGEEVARRMRALGCRIVGTRRSGAPHPLADEMVPVAELSRLLAQSDYVVLCAPLTEETREIIDATALHQMKPSAVLVNVGRGELVDEPALIEALRDGTIAGAALDVTVQEPLPPESPLWDLPNVVLTPHISGIVPEHYSRVADLFIENLRHYLAGEPLLNRIDASRGY